MVRKTNNFLSDMYLTKYMYQIKISRQVNDFKFDNTQKNVPGKLMFLKFYLKCY